MSLNKLFTILLSISYIVVLNGLEIPKLLFLENRSKYQMNEVASIEKLTQNSSDIIKVPKLSSKRGDQIFYQRCENSQRISLFSNNLKISKTDPLKEELLKEFLSLKFFQYFDIITYMIMDDFRTSFINFKILKFNSNQLYNYEQIKQHGVDSCDLERVANQNIDKIVSICPWYWLIYKRQDRYPFHLPIAKCNCVNCQAKTIFDSDRQKRSRCNLNYNLLPVLIKESINQSNEEEIWTFGLEEVPSSCYCNIKINPY